MREFLARFPVATPLRSLTARTAPLILLALLWTVQPASAASLWLGPDAQPLPFKTQTEVENFLLNAELVSYKRIGEGINDPYKVLLEWKGVQAHAVFRDVRVDKLKNEFRDGTVRLFFRDDALFEVAAYEISKMLGLENLPPAVSRSMFGKRGSLQLWIEKGTTERKRLEKDLLPSNLALWQAQLQVMRLFDNLIYNEDRNQGNILFDADWSLWMIDHTRAFRRMKELLSPKAFWRCDRELFERLKNLDEDEVREKLKSYLHPAEIKALLKRRDMLVERIETLIADRGEALVLFNIHILEDGRAAADEDVDDTADVRAQLIKNPCHPDEA